MKQSAVITTPIPSADEVATRLGLSEERKRFIRDLVHNSDGSLRQKRGDTRVGTLRDIYGRSFLQGRRSDARLETIQKETGKSLSQLVREYRKSA
jgi:hypothetical protein